MDTKLLNLLVFISLLYFTRNIYCFGGGSWAEGKRTILQDRPHLNAIVRILNEFRRRELVSEGVG